VLFTCSVAQARLDFVPESEVREEQEGCRDSPVAAVPANRQNIVLTEARDQERQRVGDDCLLVDDGNSGGAGEDSSER
jgi:hypothetical protein